MAVVMGRVVPGAGYWGLWGLWGLLWGAGNVALLTVGIVAP